MENHKELIQELKNLISANRTEKALELLAKAQLSNLDKDLIILNSRYSKVTEDQRLGVIDEDLAQRRLNKINLDLLELSEKIGKKSNKIIGAPPTLKKKVFNIWWVIAPVAVLLGLAAILHLSNQNITLRVKSGAYTFEVPAKYSMTIGELKKEIYDTYKTKHDKPLEYQRDSVEIKINNQSDLNNNITLEDAGIKDGNLVEVPEIIISLKVKSGAYTFEVPATYSMTIGELKKGISDTYKTMYGNPLEYKQDSIEIKINNQSDLNSNITLEYAGIKDGDFVEVLVARISHGNEITITACNGKYLYAGSNSNNLEADSDRVGKAETFSIIQGNNAHEGIKGIIRFGDEIVLRNYDSNRHYITAEENGTVNCSSQTRDGNTIWVILDPNNPHSREEVNVLKDRVLFKSYADKYMGVKGDGIIQASSKKVSSGSECYKWKIGYVSKKRYTR